MVGLSGAYISNTTEYSLENGTVLVETETTESPFAYIFNINISTYETVLETLCYLAVGLIGIFANAYIIFIAIYKKLVVKPFHLYLVNLSFANLLHCIIILMMAYTIAVNAWNFGGFLCQRQAELQVVFRGATFYSITCMALNRLGACYPHSKFTQIFTKKYTTYLFVILSWAIPVIFVGIPYASGWINKSYLPLLAMCDVSFETSAVDTVIFMSLQLSIVISLPFLITFVTYVFIIRSLIKRRNTLGSQSSNIEMKRASKLVLAIFSIFVFCWIPFTLYVFIDVGLTWPVPAVRLLFLLNLSENTLNPLVCILSMRDYQFKKLRNNQIQPSTQVTSVT